MCKKKRESTCSKVTNAFVNLVLCFPLETLLRSCFAALSTSDTMVSLLLIIQPANCQFAHQWLIVHNCSTDLIFSICSEQQLQNLNYLKYSYLELQQSNEVHLDQSFRQSSSPFLRIHSCLFPENHNLSYFEEQCRDICGLLRGAKYNKQMLGLSKILAYYMGPCDIIYYFLITIQY